MRKVRPKTGLHHVPLLHDNASAHKSSTVIQFLKSKKVSILSYPPYSPDLAIAILPLSETEKKKQLSEVVYSRGYV